MAVQPSDWRDLADGLRAVASRWPESADSDQLQRLCEEAGLYVAEAWKYGLFNSAGWVKVRDWVRQPRREMLGEWYCRTVECLWWGWDGWRWSKDAGWPDTPDQFPAPANMPRLSDGRKCRFTFASADGRMIGDSGPPAVTGPPASARVLRHGCIVWAGILERHSAAIRARATSMAPTDSEPKASAALEPTRAHPEQPDNANEGVALVKKTTPVEPTHSDDFTSVNWYGQQHTFAKGQQAESVRVLWAEWKKGCLGLSEKTIGEKVESSNDRFRLAHVFRSKNNKMHPAWGTMIVSAGKGVFRLCEPNHQEITT